MDNDNTYNFKILLIGNCSVGKSCILLRYSDGIFPEESQSTIGVDLRLKNINIDNQHIKLFVWDTAGQEKFKTIINTYYRGAKAVLFVYDVTDSDGLRSIEKWEDEAMRHTSEGCMKILIANKVDMKEERKITTDEGIKFAIQNQMHYYETSAKKGTNIEEMFNDIAKKLFDKHKLESKKKLEKKVVIIPMLQPKKDRAFCC